MPRPKNITAVSGWLPQLSEVALAHAVLDKAGPTLSPDDRATVADFAARLETGGQLAARDRDILINIARAFDLMPKQPKKKRSGGPVMNPGDPFSTAWTEGSEFGDRVISLYTSRDADGNLAIKPPRRMGA